MSPAEIWSNQAPEDAVAIIGMASRYPGEGKTIEGFWNMIVNGRTAHTKVPENRYNGDAWHHPDPDRKGGIVPASGNFLEEDLSLFDAAFYSMTAEEANTMDPAHRLMLELAYEGLENAGIPTNKIIGSNMGVYMGSFCKDYDYIQMADLYDVGAYAVTGNGLTMLSNRVSWFYDLRGPSMTLDTACSSGMYALHLACQSIALGEINSAIVGGINFSTHPSMTHFLSKMRMVGPDGQAHVFDERANGYGRGEAIATMIVKRLGDAIRDGDNIRAVVRASGVNQDGKTPGITMPNSQAQADLIRQTYARAGLTLNDTAFFEAHGTGTPVGDPLEMAALGATFGADRKPGDPPLYVSSVKSNVGHTEGASGIAGMMKAILMLERGYILPNADLKKLNPKLKLKEWNLEIPTEAFPWPEAKHRRISINSFAYGGANATVILDDAKSFLEANGLKGKHHTLGYQGGDQSGDDSGFSSGEDETQVTDGGPMRVFPFSTSDQAGLARMSTAMTESITRLISKSKENGGVTLDWNTFSHDLAYTLTTRRTPFDFRSCVTASSMKELKTALEAGLPKPTRISTNDNSLFVYTGQGAQWPGMGRELLSNEIFRSSIERSGALLKSFGCEWDIVECLMTSDKRVDKPNFSQPMCTAVQLGLTDVMFAWGIKPSSVVGHSSGEIGAAYAAGILTQEDAMLVAWHRGRLSADVPNRLKDKTGCMLAAGMSAEDAEEYIERCGAKGTVVVACINSPQSVTLSGDADKIDELETAIKADSKFARKLRVQTAYHSPHMKTIAEEYQASLASIAPGAPREDVRMFSSVTGNFVESEKLDGAYWVANMTNPVNFTEAVLNLFSHAVRSKGRKKVTNYSMMFEVGPHEALKGPLMQILKKVDDRQNPGLTYTSLLRRGASGETTAMEAAGIAWSRGLSVDLTKANAIGNDGKVLVDLPTYPWNHSKGFWHESEMSKAVRFKKYPRTDLLGAPMLMQNAQQPRWRNFLSVRENPWLEHHLIQNTTLFPAAGMMIMVIEALQQYSKEHFPEKAVDGVEFRNVSFGKGLVVPGAKEFIETALHLNPHKVSGMHDTIWYDWTVFSLSKHEGWVKHSWGQCRTVYSSEVVKTANEAEWNTCLKERDSVFKTAQEPVDLEAFYKGSAEVGMGYGELFTNVVESHANDYVARGKVVIPDTKSSMPYEYEYPHFIHPATLDALFHLMFLAITCGKPLEQSAVPIRMEQCYVASELLTGAGKHYHAYSTSKIVNPLERDGTLIVSDETWDKAMIIVRNMAMRTVSAADSNGVDPSLMYRKCLTSVKYLQDPEQATETSASKVLADAHGVEKINALVDTLCYKNIHVQASFYGQDVASQLKSTIAKFAPEKGSRGRFEKLAIVGSAAAEVEALKKAFAGSEVSLDFTEKNIAEVESVDELKASDFVAISGKVVTDKLLSAIVASLKLDGRLVVLDAQVPVTELKASFENAGLSAVWTDEASSVVVGSKAQNPETDLLTKEEVVLLHSTDVSDSTQSLINSLAQWIESTGAKASTATLKDAADIKGKPIISLMETETPFWATLSEQQMEAIKEISNASPFLFWVTRTIPEFAASAGALRVIRTETASLRLAYLELSAEANLQSPEILHIIQFLVNRTAAVENETIDLEYREVDGVIMIPRFFGVESLDTEVESSYPVPRPVSQKLRQAERPAKIAVAAPGNINSTFWAEDASLKDSLAPNDVEIEVSAVAMRPTDVDIVMGLSPAEIMGVEATGRVVRFGSNVKDLKVGEKVTTLKSGSARTFLRQHRELVQSVEGFAESAAALFPLEYAFAFHALVDVARFEPGQAVLINSSKKGMVDAFVQLAKYYTANIFVIADSPADKKRLVETYNLPEGQVFASEDLSFARQILGATGNMGVDVVINEANNQAAMESVQCLADMGEYVNISDERFGVPIDSTKEVRYAAINPSTMLDKRGHVLAKSMQKIYRLIRSNAIQTTRPALTLPASETTQALRMLQDPKVDKRVVLEINENTIAPMTPPKPPKLQLDGKASYVVSGGLGGLGPTIITQMVEDGARHIIVLSRRGPDLDERQQRYVNMWAEMGCKLDAVKCDCTKAADVQAFAKQAKAQGWKVRGAIQAAMILRDAPFTNMTHEQWSTGILPKIDGTRNLHAELPTDMDFFITLSSVCKTIGNSGQAQYSCGNAFQEALAEYRLKNGMKATCIDVGIMTGSREGAEAEAEWNKMLQQAPQLVPLQVKLSDLQKVLSAAMRGQLYDGSALPTTITTGISDDLGATAADLSSARWQMDPRFKMRRVPMLDRDDDGAGGDGQESVADQLKEVASLDDATRIVENAIRANLAAAMTAEPEDIDPGKPLHASGVDSLKAVEFRNWVLRDVKSDVSVFDILSAMPLGALAQKIAEKSKLLPAKALKESS